MNFEQVKYIRATNLNYSFDDAKLFDYLSRQYSSFLQILNKNLSKNATGKKAASLILKAAHIRQLIAHLVSRHNIKSSDEGIAIFDTIDCEEYRYIVQREYSIPHYLESYDNQYRTDFLKLLNLNPYKKYSIYDIADAFAQKNCLTLTINTKYIPLNEQFKPYLLSELDRDAVNPYNDYEIWHLLGYAQAVQTLPNIPDSIMTLE